MKSLQEIRITIIIVNIKSMEIFQIKYIIYRKHFPGLYRAVLVLIFLLFILWYNM